MATAVITGTINSAPTQESNIVAGGKTIILTLTGDTWVAAGATFDAQRANIIAGLTASASPTNGWNLVVKPGLAVTTVVRTNATTVTITLSAQGTYSISDFETITVTIPSTALVGAVAIVATPNFWVYDNAQRFYIRKTGDNNASGASPAEAWLTFTKALGATGIFSGSTTYVGAGSYKEVISIGMTSATVDTIIQGDITGQYTGDAGSVIYTAYTAGDYSTPSASVALNLNGRDFLTFKDIKFIGGSGTVIQANTLSSTNINFTRCDILSGGQNVSVGILLTLGADVIGTWVIDSCIFVKGSGNPISITLTRPSAADLDANIQIKNCIFIGGAATSIALASTGANTFKAGGVDIYNCSHFDGASFVGIADANLSTTIPCTVYNCYLYMGGSAFGLQANLAGQILEDYNIIASSNARSNVTAGTHSISSGTISPLFYTGIEYPQQGILRPFGMPLPGSPILGFGNQAGSPTTDIVNRTRPNTNQVYIVDWATATAGGARTLTNTNKLWGVNSYQQGTISIVGGTGSGQTKTISSNTTTVITVDGNWNTQPDNTSVYQILTGITSTTGKATAGAATSLTDGNAAWGTNMLATFTIEIMSGTGIGQTRTITSNTPTVITVPTWTTNPDNTSVYNIYKKTNISTPAEGVGPYENFLNAPILLKRMNRRQILC